MKNETKSGLCALFVLVGMCTAPFFLSFYLDRSFGFKGYNIVLFSGAAVFSIIGIGFGIEKIITSKED